MKSSTHEGFLIAEDSRRAKPVRVLLRETKRYWITRCGTKYKKKDGSKIGETWPLYCLNLESIKEL